MCKECGWEEIIEEINDHLSDEDFEWAEDTLAGIANTIQEREHVTEGQIAAVTNIESAVERRGR